MFFVLSIIIIFMGKVALYLGTKFKQISETLLSYMLSEVKNIQHHYLLTVQMKIWWVMFVEINLITLI